MILFVNFSNCLTITAIISLNAILFVSAQFELKVVNVVSVKLIIIDYQHKKVF